MTFRDLMGPVDDRIDRSRISDPLTLPDGSEIRGRFFSGHVEHQLRDGSFIGLDISFACAATPAVRALLENQLVTVYGSEYRFLQRIPDRGDDLGRTLIELGSVQ